MLDARYVAREVVGVRAAGPCRKAVADAEGVGRRQAVLHARHAVPRRVVCVCDAVVGSKSVEVIVGIDPVERIRAYGVAARDDAPYGVVFVLEAADCRVACCAPRYVRHAVHDVIRIFYHKSSRVCDRRELSFMRQAATSHPKWRT